MERSQSISSTPSLAPTDAAKPDDLAIQDLEREVSSTGSIRLAAKRLAQVAHAEKYTSRWADDPEEQEYFQAHAAMHRQELDMAGDDEVFEDEEDDGEAQEGNRHMQEVMDGLWVGDLVAASDHQELEKHGITNILSLLRPALKFPDTYAVYALEIDDSADTDLLTHLPSCVSWLKESLVLREHTLFGKGERKGEKLSEIDQVTQSPKPGGVLVHCQAGMSRSASVVAAYLMRELDLDPMQAVAMIREKRPVVEPSATFWHQLGLFYNADGRVSLKDRSTRQYYMERTTTSFINGDGSAPSMERMASYPASPSASSPPTPKGSARRKIRCKMCRRLLAVREHMMDHILDQAPLLRPRTPSNGHLSGPLSPRASFTSGAGMGFTDARGEFVSVAGVMKDRERRGSQVSDVINPLTGLPGAVRSRRASSGQGVGSGLTLYERDTASPTTPGAGPRPGTPKSKPTSPNVPLPRTQPGTASEVAPGRPTGRPLMTAEQLASRLPPHLLALRMAGSGGTGGPGAASGAVGAVLGSAIGPFKNSPAQSPEHEVDTSTSASPSPTLPTFNAGAEIGNGNAVGNGNGNGAGQARKSSLLSMSTAAGDNDGASNEKGEEGASKKDERRSSSGDMYGGPPILVNIKCSGYFVEPLTWMEPVISGGAVAGKLVCPNEKCGVKIGNFDWAGVQCGCREWVTPGFCIHRSKVDEVW